MRHARSSEVVKPTHCCGSVGVCRHTLDGYGFDCQRRLTAGEHRRIRTSARTSVGINGAPILRMSRIRIRTFTPTPRIRTQTRRTFGLTTPGGSRMVEIAMSGSSTTGAFPAQVLARCSTARRFLCLPLPRTKRIFGLSTLRIARTVQTRPTQTQVFPAEISYAWSPSGSSVWRLKIECRRP